MPIPPIILFPITLPGALARDACRAYRPVAANAPLPITLQARQSCEELRCCRVDDEAAGEETSGERVMASFSVCIKNWADGAKLDPKAFLLNATVMRGLSVERGQIDGVSP